MGSEGRWSGVFTGPRLLAGALVLGGAVLVYVFGFSKSEIIFDMKVDEVVRYWQKFADQEQRVRVNGALVPGSLVRLESCEHRFRLMWNGREIAVRVPRERLGDGCPRLPDTFCESPEGNAGVVAEGYVEGTAERPGFVAEKVMMKYYRIEDLRCLPIPLVR
jgi:cytochrome c-type biogenesis protein CcmE